MSNPTTIATVMLAEHVHKMAAEGLSRDRLCAFLGITVALHRATDFRHVEGALPILLKLRGFTEEPAATVEAEVTSRFSQDDLDVIAAMFLGVATEAVSQDKMPYAIKSYRIAVAAIKSSKRELNEEQGLTVQLLDAIIGVYESRDKKAGA